MTKKTKIETLENALVTAEEIDRWKRFKRETKADRCVLVAILNARVAHDNEHPAAQAYDQFLKQLMMIYVSAPAFERYDRGFTEEDLEVINDHSLEAWGVVDAENSMMATLKSMMEAHPLERQHYVNTYAEHLFHRWQWREMLGADGVAALSADGVNVIKE